ncbi:MAG: hypothetical protein SFV32_07270 [Opitutaceae bacterium]|nr:hypothetical protein [Opitutaceae bacterium]
MRPRIQQELALLRRDFGTVDYAESAGEDWFLLPDYGYPPGWNLNGKPVVRAPVSFKLAATYPAANPYAFMTPAGLTFGDAAPGNTTVAPAGPFPGSWLLFSWQPDGNWQPAANADEGSNLLSWARSFATRLKEGA